MGGSASSEASWISSFDMGRGGVEGLLAGVSNLMVEIAEPPTHWIVGLK